MVLTGTQEEDGPNQVRLYYRTSQSDKARIAHSSPRGAPLPRYSWARGRGVLPAPANWKNRDHGQRTPLRGCGSLYV